MIKKGNVLFAVVLLLGLLMTMALALSSAILSTNVKIQKSYLRLSALAFAEAGVNKALWEINSGNPTFASTGWVLDNSLSGGEFRTNVTPCENDPANVWCKQITSIGYIPNYANPITSRTVKIKISGVDSVTNINFQFAAQSNSNLVEMLNGAVVKGSVYSNGPILMGSKAKITGNATSSGNTPTTSYIYKTNGSTPDVNGTAQAYTITGVNAGTKITGDYPPPQTMPISDSELESTISTWEAVAQAGYNSPGSLTISGLNNQLGPAKINGDLIINGDLQINGTIWVDGNITIAGGSHVYLNSNFENNGGVIIADYRANRSTKGKITIGNSAYISGVQKYNPKTPSYTLLFSTFTNNATNWNTDFAISLDDPGTQGGVYYAPFGSFYLKNNGQIRAVAANGLILAENAILDYDSNWGNSGISNGPAGKWTITEWQIMY